MPCKASAVYRRKPLCGPAKTGISAKLVIAKQAGWGEGNKKVNQKKKHPTQRRLDMEFCVRRTGRKSKKGQLPAKGLEFTSSNGPCPPGQEAYHQN